jgi:HEAT repeat protein
MGRHYREDPPAYAGDEGTFVVESVGRLLARKSYTDDNTIVVEATLLPFELDFENDLRPQLLKTAIQIAGSIRKDMTCYVSNFSIVASLELPLVDGTPDSALLQKAIEDLTLTQEAAQKYRAGNMTDEDKRRLDPANWSNQLAEDPTPQRIQTLIRIVPLDKDMGIRRAAIEALVKIGSPAVPPLKKALEDNRGDICGVFAYILGRIRNPDAIPSLIAALANDGRGVRKKVAEALGRIGDHAVQPLIDLLADKKEDIRKSAVYALGVTRSPDAVPILITQLQGRGVGEEAAQALIRIGKPAVDALLHIVNHDNDLREAAAEMLGEIGDARAVGPLIKVLENSWRLVYVRERAARSLGKLKDRCATPSLIGALRDDSISGFKVQIAAAKALGEIKDPEAIGPLIQLFADENRDVRQTASDALVEIGEPAVPQLNEAQKHPNKDIMDMAEVTLRKINLNICRVT